MRIDRFKLPERGGAVTTFLRPRSQPPEVACRPPPAASSLATFALHSGTSCRRAYRSAGFRSQFSSRFRLPDRRLPLCRGTGEEAWETYLSPHKSAPVL